MKKARFIFLRATMAAAMIVVGALWGMSYEREAIWPKGKMPDAQGHQHAAMLNEASLPDFKPEKHRGAYLEWYEKPETATANGCCMILISGGGYETTCDMHLIDLWHETFTRLGYQCVNLVYRTPWPKDLPIYQTAWEDGQRAVKLVRSQAAKRGYDPEKIGTISMSAGSHLALLLATSSQTPAYEKIDKLDETPCHINYAIVNAPAFVTTDGETGTACWAQGYGADIRLSDCFKFDEKTPPMSFHHGGADVYSPNGSTLLYRKLRTMGIPTELHLYPNLPHGAYGLERGIEFLNQLEIPGKLAPEESLEARYSSDEGRASYRREAIWPEGKMPNRQAHQVEPFIEWHFPKERKTDAIQIIYSGGAYVGDTPESFEVAPVRRYLNELGMTVVTMLYRYPRPEGLAKHTTAWQDLQRAIRVVRSQAAGLGLDPGKIGIMGSSAGGHLTLLGVTSSMHQSYNPIDALDALPCNVQWGIGIYPAYALTDGLDQPNTTGGNDDSAMLAPEFSFDLATCPMLFLHGDADKYASMNSVKTWEKMRSMGIQSELHTLALRDHCFQRTASPGTGSYTWMERIREFLEKMTAPLPSQASAATMKELKEEKTPGLAMTPPMGWNSWNKFHTDIDEEKIRGVVDALIETGLRDAGYIYVNLDDAWHGPRDAQGFITCDAERFPSGMKALSDYIHDRGMKFGVYSDAGYQTCALYPGSRGHEFQDAQTYANWGVDYLKYDWFRQDLVGAEGAYTLMRDALSTTGRPIVFSICEWGENDTFSWAPHVGHLWRTGGDIGAYFDVSPCHEKSILEVIENNYDKRQYAGPDHWNDPDNLEVGNGMSVNQDRAHFSIWCMMAAPLILGNDVRNMSEETLAILKNSEAIAIDQDPLGIQGLRVKVENGVQYWLKPLTGGDWAVCLFNAGKNDVVVDLDWSELDITDDLSGMATELGKKTYNLQNVWTGQDDGLTDNARRVEIGAEDVVMWRLSGC